MQVTDKITLTLEDNMLLMGRYPDNYFDLAIVDPPYGIGIVAPGKRSMGHRSGQRKLTQYKPATWDNEIPSADYFKELFRVSKNQIIWGANHFTQYLPSSSAWIVWDKNQPEGVSFAMAELAFSSFEKRSAKTFYWSRGKEKKQHPTQKPVELYKWLLHNYANKGDKILDTHLGSGSIALACMDYDFELTACEIDSDYYETAINRVKNHEQAIIFPDREEPLQTNLFL